MSASDQKKIFRQSTHFNPVYLICGARDWKGNSFDLTRCRDPLAVFINHKSMNGRRLKALELPGLWNGSVGNVQYGQNGFRPIETRASNLIILLTI